MKSPVVKVGNALGTQAYQFLITKKYTFTKVGIFGNKKEFCEVKVFISNLEKFEIRKVLFVINVFLSLQMYICIFTLKV